MKSKFLFLLLVGLILGGLVVSGFALFEEHSCVFYLVETLGLLIAVLLVILYRRLVRPY